VPLSRPRYDLAQLLPCELLDDLVEADLGLGPRLAWCHRDPSIEGIRPLGDQAVEIVRVTMPTLCQTPR
jgi:hypothetical protein